MSKCAVWFLALHSLLPTGRLYGALPGNGNVLLYRAVHKFVFVTLIMRLISPIGLSVSIKYNHLSRCFDVCLAGFTFCKECK